MAGGGPYSAKMLFTKIPPVLMGSLNSWMLRMKVRRS